MKPEIQAIFYGLAVVLFIIATFRHRDGRLMFGRLDSLQIACFGLACYAFPAFYTAAELGW